MLAPIGEGLSAHHAQPTRGIGATHALMPLGGAHIHGDLLIRVGRHRMRVGKGDIAVRPDASRLALCLLRCRLTQLLAQADHLEEVA